MEPSRNNQHRRAARRKIAACKRRAKLKLLCGVLFLILAVILAAAVMLLFKDNGKPDPTQGTSEPPTQSTTLPAGDITPPSADPVGEIVVLNGDLPDPATLITNVRDESDVTVTWMRQPDVSQSGESTGLILLTDAAGNTAIVEVVVNVIVDTQPPVIEGAVDLEFYVGDPISYKKNITVTDDLTEFPDLTVDNSLVDTTKPGQYLVTYTATDEAGNSASVTVMLTLKDKPQGYVDLDVVYGLAQEVLDQITTEEMTDMEVAFAIYRWVSTNIGYTGHSDKSHWTTGAYQAFTERAGDCFNYYAAAKAMYEVVGIENVDVVKLVTENTSQSSHFWSLINLGDGWYHVDCTPRKKPGKFFMNTDAELEAYSVENRYSHNFDGSLYPERATESVQDKVDYENGEIRD